LAALIATALRLPARRETGSESKMGEEIVGEYILVRDIH